MNTKERKSIAEFYDHFIPYRDRADVKFFVDLAVENGGPVLEIGCGTGRVLIPTARAGIEIVGLDLAEDMLAVCRRHLGQEDEPTRARTRLVVADMRDFDLGRQFTLITTPFRPFEHLITVQDQMACLACVHRHLAPGGRFVLDMPNPSITQLADDRCLQETGDEPEFTMPDGRRVRRRQRVVSKDLIRQVNEFELIYHVTDADGREERLVYRFPRRYLFRYEAEHLLARAGFRVEALYSGYTGRPYGTVDDRELVFVTTKV